MALTKATQLNESTIRLTCGECNFIHEISMDENNKLTVETFVPAGTKEKKEESKTPPPEPKKPVNRFFKGGA